VLGLVAVSLVLVLALTEMAVAQVEQVGDNCWKIDNPESDSYQLGNSTVQLQFTTTTVGQEFSFVVTAGDLLVSEVRVSGGSEEQTFTFNPPVGSGSGLHAPQVPSGKWADVSNVTFCFAADGTTTTTGQETTTTTAQGTTTTAAGTTTTTSETTTTTVAETTSTTVGGVSTTVEEETSTTGDLTTVTQIQTGEGPPPSGPGAAVWTLGALALALAFGLGWSLMRQYRGQR
jgi:hypothetical protein